MTDPNANPANPPAGTPAANPAAAPAAAGGFMTPEQQMMMFQMMMQQQMAAQQGQPGMMPMMPMMPGMAQPGMAQPGMAQPGVAPGAAAPAAAAPAEATPAPAEPEEEADDELTDDTSVEAMLAKLNVKLKKSQKMMKKWQEYIEDEQCIETVGELCTVIKHGAAWKEFSLPAIAKIAIEELLHDKLAPEPAAAAPAESEPTPSEPAPAATPATEPAPPAETVVTEDVPAPKEEEKKEESEKKEEEKKEEEKKEEEKTDEKPAEEQKTDAKGEEPPPPPTPEDPDAEEWFPQAPPPQPPSVTEEAPAAPASETKEEVPEGGEAAAEGGFVLKAGEVLGMDITSVLTVESDRTAFAEEDEIQYWIEDMGAVTASLQTGFHVVVTNSGGKQSYGNQNLYLQNVVVEVHGPRGPIDVMARLLPIPGEGVPANVVTDFSTDAAFLFLSSSSAECPFSVGDSLAFTEKMTSIWFAFTPPEEGVYSLYIFHHQQEVGAAEFDVFLPGALEDGMLPEGGADGYNAGAQNSTLRGLTCEIDGLEEFVKAGVEAKFTVRPVNSRKEPQMVFVQINTMIKGPDGRIVKATVVPRENGTYDIFCTPPKKGQYQVQLLENAELVTTQPTEVFMQVYGDEAEDTTVQKGIMRILVTDDAVLKQLGLNSTVKTVKITPSTTTAELKELVMKHMSRGMNVKQLKAIEARCKTFIIKEVGEENEDIRTLGNQERVWPWERDHGTKTSRLVFSQAKGQAQGKGRKFKVKNIL